jgi:endonuclease/exonuclease/phosphatase family metal-dependent hydrolase
MDRDRRIKIILKRLYRENPDLMLLQEVMDVDYDVLYLHFQKTYYISSLQPIQWGKSNNSSSGNITLIRKSMCKKISEYRLEYGLIVKADDLVIYNIHLDDVSFTKRKKQINALRPNIEKERYVVLGGDFNQEYKKTCSLYQFPEVTVHNKCVTYFVEKNMNIDNILTKGFTDSNHTCSYVPRNVTEGLEIYGSDHIPVTANVY